MCFTLYLISLDTHFSYLLFFFNDLFVYLRERVGERACACISRVRGSGRGRERESSANSLWGVRSATQPTEPLKAPPMPTFN